MALQIRRGNTADRLAKTFAEGELIYDTQTKEVFIGDGATQGGKTVSTYTDAQAKDAAAATLTHNTGHSNVSFAYNSVTKQVTATVALDGTYNDVVQDTTPELGGDLSLNGFSVKVGSNTVIDGTTGRVYANVTGSLTGNADSVTNGVYTTSTVNIGTTAITLNRAAGVQTLTGVSIDGNAATVTNGVYTTGDQTISGVLSATAFDGNIYGSVYGSDGSTLLVDADNNRISADTLSAANVTISGNLIVSGTTTTVNSTTVNIADLNITLASGAETPAEAEGAGISIAGANATMIYAETGDKLVFNKRVDAPNFYGDLTGSVTGNTSGTHSGAVTGNVTGNVTLPASGLVDATNGRVLLGAGTVTLPSLTFATEVDGDTGLYLFGQGTIGFASNGIIGVTIGPSGNVGIAGTVTAPDFSGNISSSGTSTFNTARIPYLRGFTNGATIQVQDPIDLIEPASATLFSVAGTFNVYKQIDAFDVELRTEFTGEKVTYGVPVQFGRYTTAERDALNVVLAVDVPGDSTVGAVWSGGVATLQFAEQAEEVFDVGASITVAGINPGGFNGSVVVTASTRSSVSYAVVSDPGTYVDGGTITGPVPKGTVIYNRTAAQFQGYAGAEGAAGGWVALS